jgi:AraC-like DNA-binding protein
LIESASTKALPADQRAVFTEKHAGEIARVPSPMSDFTAPIRLLVAMEGRTIIERNPLHQIEGPPNRPALDAEQAFFPLTDPQGSPLPSACRNEGRAAAARHPRETMRETNDGRIKRTVDFIHRNIHRPIRLRELLEIASMPRRTFERHFLEMVGIEPHSFINRCRVECASRLLKSRKKRTLTEIAVLSGFANMNAFRGVFLDLTGLTPAAYQQRGGRVRRRATARPQPTAREAGVPASKILFPTILRCAEGNAADGLIESEVQSLAVSGGRDR